jgi:threonine synthase
VLRALRERGIAAAATEDEIRTWTRRLAAAGGIDAAPEGGCAMAVTATLVASGRLSADAEVVVYNTGSGASIRSRSGAGASVFSGTALAIPHALRSRAILDPFSGISGDMTLGALLDAGLPGEWLRGSTAPWTG